MNAPASRGWKGETDSGSGDLGLPDSFFARLDPARIPLYIAEMDTDQSVNLSDSPRPPGPAGPMIAAREIARAALELFVTRGFAATKLDDVAKAAGVSKGLPYLYFKNKEELFKAVIAEAIGEPLVRADELVDSYEGSTEDLLRELVAMFRAFAESPLGGVIKLILAEAGNFPDVARFYCSNFDAARPRAVRQDAAPRRRARRVPPDRRYRRDRDHRRPAAGHALGLAALARALRHAGADRATQFYAAYLDLDPARDYGHDSQRRDSCMLQPSAAVLVLASGAFAWKSGPARTAAQRRLRPAAASRPIELIPEEAAHDQAARPGRHRALHRHDPADRPDDREGARRRTPRRGAGPRRRQGQRRASCSRASRPPSCRRRSTSASRRSMRRAPSSAGRRATARTRRRSPPATSSRSRPPTRRVRPPRTRPRWSRSSEAQLEVARKNLADAEVRAPFDGVVGERIANQGESLPIDGKILALLDTSHVEIAAQMPAADVVRLQVGQAADRHASKASASGRSTAGSRASARRRRQARARSRSMSRSSTATTACAAACSAWARSPSRRRPMRWPCPPRRCARTTRATSC